MADMTVKDPKHSSHLVEGFTSMRKEGELFDFVIKGNEQSFNIHSRVLASVSPTFRAMLRAEMEESAKKEATFPAIPDHIISAIIDFAYDGEVTFKGPQLMDLIEAAHYLQISKLLQLCEEQMITVLDSSNAISWYHFADGLDSKRALDTILEKLQTSLQDIANEDEFKELEIAELKRYLRYAHENSVSSDDLVYSVVHWLKQNPSNRSTHMPELFKMIPIGKCSETFLGDMIKDNAELLDSNLTMYKLMLSDVLDNANFKSLGEDKTILLVGGQSLADVSSSVCWLLQDLQMEKLCETTANIVMKPYHSVCEIPSGMMITGGKNSNLCVIFIPTLKMWARQPGLLSTRYSHGSACINGKVFVICGKVSGLRTRGVDYMNLDEKVWYNGPALPDDELLPVVITCKAKLFVLFSSKRCMYQLYMDKMTWSAKAPLPQASYKCSIAVSKDRMFAAGGFKNINYMYTPTTDQWCRLTSPSINDSYGSLVCYQQKLYLLAGCKRDSELQNVEMYDIRSDRWSLAQWKLPAPMFLFHAFLVDVGEYK